MQFAALSKALGLNLPMKPKTTASNGSRTALWLGPDEWLIIDDADSSVVADLAKVKVLHSAVDISHRNVGIIVAGKGAAAVVNGGCPQDLSLKAFPVGAASRTVLGKIEIVLWRTGEDSFPRRMLAIVFDLRLCISAGVCSRRCRLSKVLFVKEPGVVSPCHARFRVWPLIWWEDGRSSKRVFGVVMVRSEDRPSGVFCIPSVPRRKRQQPGSLPSQSAVPHSARPARTGHSTGRGTLGRNFPGRRARYPPSEAPVLLPLRTAPEAVPTGRTATG